MDIIRKLFTFNDDDTSAIGLCKFSDSFYKEMEAKKNFKKRVTKEATLSEILKNPYKL